MSCSETNSAFILKTTFTQYPVVYTNYSSTAPLYGAVAGHVKHVDHDDVFDALLFREETLTRHYFKLKFDFSWGIRTNMGKTEGICLNLQCNCHIVGSIIIKLIIHRTISVHGCQM